MDGDLEQVPFAPVAFGRAHVVDLSVVQTHDVLHNVGAGTLGAREREKIKTRKKSKIKLDKKTTARLEKEREKEVQDK